MKISDIKGDAGKNMAYWVQRYINDLVFDNIKVIAPSLRFNSNISLYRMEDFKKLLSGVRVGYHTHGCKPGETPWCSWVMGKPGSTYCAEPVKIDAVSLDIPDPEGLFQIEVDLEDVHKTGNYWQVNWSIKANKTALLEKLGAMFDEDVEKKKSEVHTDYKGQVLKIGDIICYSTTYSNNVRIGTIDKFNDHSMVVDGHNVQYDASVLVVNKEIKFNEQTKKYEHR